MLKEKGVKIYSEADLTQARIDAFNAARELRTELMDGIYGTRRFKTDKDYLQSLNNK